jgi:branched-chain amino acid transport system substrate-binding protein
MLEKEERKSDETQEPSLLDGKKVSRRDFLKIAGAAGATVGLAGGLGSFVAACAKKEETSTTAAPSTSTTKAAGRDIKVGLVSPLTGALAGFGMPMTFLEEKWNEALVDGVVCGDGLTHNIVMNHVDTQSDNGRAAGVAGDLINNDNVDVILVSSSPDTVVPVAVQCEALGVPCISSFVPWQPFFFGRQETPDPTKAFKWTYSHALGLEEIVAAFIDIWDRIETNNVCGLFFANDADGVAWIDENTGLPPAMRAAGYTVFDPGLYPVTAQDFSTEIAYYKKHGCEICTGTVIAPDFSNFWTQAYQQRYQPKILTIGKALLFPETVASVGDIAVNTTVEYTWGPHWPFRSSLTGETCQELADDYEARTGNQWTAPIGTYDRMEWLVDALKRTDDVDDKEKLIKAIATTKMDTMLGPIDFTAPIQMGTLHPVENVYMPPIGGGQWVKGTKHPYEIVQVGNVWAPQCDIQADPQPMQYS